MCIDVCLIQNQLAITYYVCLPFSFVILGVIINRVSIWVASLISDYIFCSSSEFKPLFYNTTGS